VAISPNQSIEWSFTKNLAFMGCSVGFKYSKNALAAGALPGPHWGSSRRSLIPLTQKEGGQGSMPPKPCIKKLKLSCRVTHIDVLAVAAITIKQRT